MRPMLADSISVNDLPAYIDNPDWWAQLKADGQRFLVVVDDGHIKVLGRNGQPKVNGLSYQTLAPFDEFTKGHWVFDGELVGSKLLLFDMPEAPGFVTKDDPYEKRYETLRLLMGEWHTDVVGLLPCAMTADEKLALARQAQVEQREGIMLKFRSGLYQPGRRSLKMLKCKFTKEADCIVTEVGRDGHDNVVLALIDADAGTVVEVGSASAIGKRPTPEPGDVWEVKFLYVVDPARPRLYQPRLMRKRTDKELSECLIDQLAHAYTDKMLDIPQP